MLALCGCSECLVVIECVGWCLGPAGETLIFHFAGVVGVVSCSVFAGWEIVVFVGSVVVVVAGGVVDAVCCALVFFEAAAVVVVGVVGVVVGVDVVGVVGVWLPPRMFFFCVRLGVLLPFVMWICMRGNLCRWDSVVVDSCCMLVFRLSSVLFGVLLSCISCSVVFAGIGMFCV